MAVNIAALTAAQPVPLARGVVVHCRHATTVMILDARQDPAVAAAEEGSDLYGVLFALALARRAIVAWDGVVGDDDLPAPVTPANVDALLGAGDMLVAWAEGYVHPANYWAQEKNGSGPSPNGISERAGATASGATRRAKHPARGARTSKGARKA